MQTENQIVWKCTNKNLSIWVILNVVSIFRTYLSKSIFLLTLIVKYFLIKDVQMKNRIV